MPVYNLTVEGAGCYYANGILVSNCDCTSGALRQWLEVKPLTEDQAQLKDAREQEEASLELRINRLQMMVRTSGYPKEWAEEQIRQLRRARRRVGREPGDRPETGRDPRVYRSGYIGRKDGL